MRYEREIEEKRERERIKGRRGLVPCFYGGLHMMMI